MKIGIPVACHNGHPSTWVLEIVGLEARDVGAMDLCRCPKWGAGEGWGPTGAPFVMPAATTSPSSLEGLESASRRLLHCAWAIGKAGAWTGDEREKKATEVAGWAREAEAVLASIAKATEGAG